MIVNAYEFVTSETKKYRYTVLVQTTIVTEYVILAPWEREFSGSGLIWRTSAEAAQHLRNYPKGSRIEAINRPETEFRKCRHKK